LRRVEVEMLIFLNWWKKDPDCPLALTSSPHWPHSHVMKVDTTHWNHVMKRGAGIDMSSEDIKNLFRKTIEIDTTQYEATTNMMCLVLLETLVAIIQSLYKLEKDNC